jgi:hypothetical protein
MQAEEAVANLTVEMREDVSAALGIRESHLALKIASIGC